MSKSTSLNWNKTYDLGIFIEILYIHSLIIIFLNASFFLTSILSIFRLILLSATKASTECKFINTHHIADSTLYSPRRRHGTIAGIIIWMAAYLAVK